MEVLELDRIRLDAFKEIVSIATGSAATGLSRMLGMRVGLTVPNIMVETFKNVPGLFGGPEKTVVAVCFSLSGPISGTILLLLAPDEAVSLANMLTKKSARRMQDLDEMAVSALKELGNIVTGAYVCVLADELGVKATYSVPGLSYDMVGAILDETLARMSLEADYAVILESEFTIMGKVYRGHLVSIAPPDTVKAIVGALGDWSAET